MNEMCIIPRSTCRNDISQILKLFPHSHNMPFYTYFRHKVCLNNYSLFTMHSKFGYAQFIGISKIGPQSCQKVTKINSKF